MSTSGRQAQLHGNTSFLGHAQTGDSRSVDISDTREALIHNKRHAVCAIALLNDFGHFAGATCTADLIV